MYRPCIEEFDLMILVGPFQLRHFVILSLLNSHIHSQSPESGVVLSLGSSTREFWPILVRYPGATDT